MLFPYDSETNKNLIAEHIELHKADKMSSCPEVILNICKLMERYFIFNSCLKLFITNSKTNDFFFNILD